VQDRRVARVAERLQVATSWSLGSVSRLSAWSAWVAMTTRSKRVTAPVLSWTCTQSDRRVTSVTAADLRTHPPPCYRRALTASTAHAAGAGGGHRHPPPPGPIRHGFGYGVYQWLVDLTPCPSNPVPAPSPAQRRPIISATRRARSRRMSSPSGPARNHPDAGPAGSSCSATPGSWARVRPAVGLLVLGRGRRPGGHRRRGAQHLRRAARLPSAPRPLGFGHHDKRCFVSPFYDVTGRYELRFELRPRSCPPP